MTQKSYTRWSGDDYEYEPSSAVIANDKVYVFGSRLSFGKALEPVG